MMMRTIREKTRYAIVFLAVAFAAWLAFEGFQERGTAASTGPNPVIGVVNGAEIRFARWRDASARQLDAARARKGAALTDEEVRQAEQDAWESMVNSILIEQEIERLGIRVSEGEIRQAFRTSPPPDIMQLAAFQTDGRFDYAKYQAFFADPSVDEALLRSIEAYYRSEIPRMRLQQELVQGVAVSDADAWEEFRARNETAVVTHVSVDPTRLVADADIEVSEADARRFYRENREQFERPATATVRLVSFSSTPTAQDTARVLARADSIRAEVLSGAVSFEEAAREHSADSVSAENGGALGRYRPEDLLEPFSSTVANLGEGEVSEAVTTSSGVHLMHVTAMAGDTADVSHLVLPIALSEQGEDELFGRMDELEGVALDQGLQAAADSFGVDVREDVTLTDGFDFVPGAGSLGVAVDWALLEYTEVGELSEFFENGSGFHIMELVDRTEAGEFTFAEVRDQIEAQLRVDMRKAAAMTIVRTAVEALENPDLATLASSNGWAIATTEPFNRRQFVAGLGRDTEAVGAAFGAPVGRMVGPFDGGDRVVVLRVDERTEADPALFEVMKGQLKSELEAQAVQRRAVAWLDALRTDAEVVDLRDRLDQPVETQPFTPPLI